MTTTTSLTRRTGAMSEAEYLALTEELPWTEYVDGVAEEKCLGDYEHGFIQAELSGLLSNYRKLYGGKAITEGRARYRRADASSDYRVPDIAFYPKGTDARREGERIMQPPALAIEIRSQDETISKQREKCRWYRARGVAECWLIDPYRRTFELFNNENDGTSLSAETIVTSALLPGLELSLADLFAGLDD